MAGLAATVRGTMELVRVMRMERFGCVVVVRGPIPGGSFGVRDGAPLIESSLNKCDL
jgi:hypothetical protein